MKEEQIPELYGNPYITRSLVNVRTHAHTCTHAHTHTQTLQWENNPEIMVHLTHTTTKEFSSQAKEKHLLSKIVEKITQHTAI